ncbi:DUF4252 domain-containing protein [Chryseobacterium balustinum]|uniref:Auto-transporter adhesin, head GIN domain n=1 Tax=Chryseobacterium balustinum TaxID=246 RepID=A0AAX2IGN5_9FLAO|nr:DUF4252 domain-containing protein [Chryseobacterium balustinum]AZB31679.1 DUF4252 domain-containing protein [Chryseobacterium balustinum]SKB84751.1 Putative auto-transporter adhesin, head GIN domain [Chryseobacterium balustinum]SQA86959.1 Protein of uncharacterised function (DUF2807) [Chryseobacterium balustinum]
MKKIFIICTLVLSHFLVYGQKNKLDQLFDKYQEVEGVTSIKIAKPMFGMLSNLNIADAELDQIKPLLAKINGLKILITENPEGNSKANINQLNKEISTFVKNLNYSEIMSVKNGGSKIKFLSSEAEKDGTLENMLLNIDSGGGESILVMLDGKLSMDDVNKIINSNETKTNTTRTTMTSSFASENTSSYLNGESRNVGQFSGIDVSAGVKVVFTQENSTSVKVFADADKLQNVITKVENGILKISIDNKGTKNLRFKNLSVNVSSPKMDRIKTSSGSNFTTVNEIRGKEMTVDVSSGSGIVAKFQISGISNIEASSGSNVKASISSDKVLVKSSSGSSIKLEGNAEYVSIDASSGASCKADQLTANIGVVESTSGSSVSVSAKDKLTVKASSAGSVKYRGNPKIEANISKSSAGSLNQIN